MKRFAFLRLVSAIAFFGLQAAESRAAGKLEQSEGKTVALQRMSEAIQKVLRLKTASYHVFLREASLIVPPVFKGREWADVEKLMAKHSFAVVEAWENGDAVHSHHLARRNAILLPGGHSLDLEFQFSALNLDRTRLPAKPGKLYAANVVLVSRIGAPYSKVAKDRFYPKGSVLDALLTSGKLEDQGRIWPILDLISVHYDYLYDRWADHSPSGFRITVEFVASKSEEIGAERMDFCAASGLDPLQSAEGKEKLLNGFKAQDTIEYIKGGGSLEWWKGEPGTIEANKRKYLTRKGRP
jgi:hypothetical protein